MPAVIAGAHAVIAALGLGNPVDIVSLYHCYRLHRADAGKLSQRAWVLRDQEGTMSCPSQFSSRNKTAFLAALDRIDALRMMSEEPPREDTDFDRDFWRSHARRALQEAFDALEGGRVHFGDWERLFLSAAIDHFRDRHFEQASMSAQRIFYEQQRPPFTGQFTQEKNLADLRAEYEELARKTPD